MGVDLHCELAASEPARDGVVTALDRSQERLAGAFPGFDVKRHDSAVWRWLSVHLDITELGARNVAEGMKRLIEVTRDDVEAELASHR